MAAREHIEAVMRRVRRGEFLPGDVKRHAGLNSALPIGFGQTNSQPTTVADMMELLDVPARARVLDVGSGSGWSTAILAELVGPAGEVHGAGAEDIIITAHGAYRFVPLLCATHVDRRCSIPRRPPIRRRWGVACTSVSWPRGCNRRLIRASGYPGGHAIPR